MSATGGGNTFGRSIFELSTNRSRFKSELSASEVDARQSSSLINRELEKAGESLGDGAKKGKEELDRELREARRRAAAHARDIDQALGQIAGGAGLGSLAAAAGPVSALVAGLAGLVLAAKGAAEATRAVVDTGFQFNRNLQNSTNNLTAYTGSLEGANRALRLARQEADAGRGSFTDLAQAIATLTPSANAVGVPMQSLIQLAEILAATNPAEGIAGAAYALREAASGDFTSVAERFNVSRRSIQAFRDQGVNDIDAVRKTLEQMGITFSVVEQNSRSVDVLSARLQGLGQRFAGEGTQPFFAAYNAGLLALVNTLSDPRIEKGVQALRSIAQAVTDGFGRGFDGGEFAELVEDSLDNIEDFADSSEGLRDELGKLAQAFGYVFTGATIFAEGIGDLYSGLARIPGAVEVLSDLAARAAGLSVVKGLYDFAIGVVEIRRELDELAKREDVLGKFARVLGGGRSEIREAPERTLNTPSPAIDPGTEKAFDQTIETLKNSTIRAARDQANTYVRTFSSEMASQFEGARGVLDDILSAAVGGDESKIDPVKRAQGFAALAQAISEIGTKGEPSAEVMDRLRAILGDSAPSVIQYVQTLDQLVDAQNRLELATFAVSQAQRNYTQAQEEARNATANAQKGIDAAERDRRVNQEAAQRAQADQRAEIERIGAAARVAAAEYERIGRALEAQAAAARSAAQAAQEQRREAIAAAQEEVSRSQDLAREHAAAFAAIQSGTVAEFLALNGEIDESTRKIIESYNGQAEAAIKARNAAQDRADGIGVEGRRVLLDLETRIRAARQNGNFAEAAALERQRDIERQRYTNREAYARQQAAVAQDEVNAALKPIEAAAQAQAAQDAAATRAAQARLGQLQQEDEAKRKSEAAALAAIEAEIARNAEAARQEAERYKASEEAARTRLQEIKDTADEQDRRDRQSIEFQKGILAAVKEVGDEKVRKSKDALDNAKNEEEAAKNNLQYQREQIAALKEKIKIAQEWLDQHPGFTPNFDFTPGNTPVPQIGPRPQPPTYNDPPPNDPATAGGSAGAAAAAGFGRNALRAGVPLSGLREYFTPAAAALSIPTFDLARRRSLGGVQDIYGDIGAGGGTAININAPINDFSGMVVDSAERAREVVRRSNEGLMSALESLKNTGRPTFKAG